MRAISHTHKTEGIIIVIHDTRIEQISPLISRQSTPRARLIGCVFLVDYVRIPPVKITVRARISIDIVRQSPLSPNACRAIVIRVVGRTIAVPVVRFIYYFLNGILWGKMTGILIAYFLSMPARSPTKHIYPTTVVFRNI